MSFGKKYEHESYGMIGISHISGGSRPLFGSAIKHDRTIKLVIRQADVERHLKQEWYHGQNTIVEIELSAAQFTQFITNPNCGDGVPCTIKQVSGKSMASPPYRGQNEIFNQELQKDFQKAMSDSDDLVDSACEMLGSKGPMKVADKKELLAKIKSLVQHIQSNMPFLHKQFTRSMDKTVMVAKAEIENFYTSTIMKMGKKALESGHFPEKPKIEEHPTHHQ